MVVRMEELKNVKGDDKMKALVEELKDAKGRGCG